MRKINAILKQAWDTDTSKTISNSQVLSTKEGTILRLHGNVIAFKCRNTGNVYYTLAGWNTVTTRSRLNGVLDVGVYQRKYLPMVNGFEIRDSGWYSENNQTGILAPMPIESPIP